MAGTVIDNAAQRRRGRLCELEFQATADAADGTVPATASMVPIDGIVKRVVHVPGSTPLEDGVDVAINDENGIDILKGEWTTLNTGAARDSPPHVFDAAGAAKEAPEGIPVMGPLTLAITGNTTNGATGTFKVLFERLQ